MSESLEKTSVQGFYITFGKYVQVCVQIFVFILSRHKVAFAFSIMLICNTGVTWTKQKEVIILYFGEKQTTHLVEE